MRFLLLNIFVCLFTITVHAESSNRFTFDLGIDAWQNWGEGEFEHNDKVGRKNRGSLQVRTGYGEEHNLYYNFTGLKAGTYQVEFYLKGVDLGANAVWHFVDIGEGTQSIFEQFSGDTDWVQVKYTIEVTKSKLALWLRLKGPGQLFLDDFSLRKVRNKKKLTFKNILKGKQFSPSSFPTKNQCAREGSYWSNKHKTCPHCGSDFLNNHYHGKKSNSLEISSKKYALPFKLNSKGQGLLTPRTFYNFDVGEYASIDWTQFNRIELEVINPTSEATEFSLVMGDNNSNNYWSQLNHTASLALGLNKLSFSLTRNVGERGSTRYYRSLNLKRLQKFFIIVDQDKKRTLNKPFLIQNIRLVSKKYPKVPNSIKVFDFTSHKASSLNGIVPVTSQTQYHKKRKYGFRNTEFWRVNDSVYSSSIDRYTLGVKKGEFLVDLPNGKYEVTLEANALGYWDTNFWSYRSIDLNGETLLLEKRDTYEEYLSNLLQFQEVEPSIKDDPYNLYLKKIFRPLTKFVEVKNGKLNISFNADATGVELNSLMITPVKIDRAIKKYKEELSAIKKMEFEWLSRKIVTSSASHSVDQIGVVKTHLELSPNNSEKIISKEINLTGASGEKPFVILQIPEKEKDIEYKFSISELTSGKKKVSGNRIKFEMLMNQYVSRDMNHETYEILGKYLGPLKKPFIVKQNTNRFLKIGIDIDEGIHAGNYTGSLEIKFNKKNTIIPIKFIVLNTSLPKINFPVGFLGLSPLPKSYFKGEGGDFQQKMNMKSLEMIARRGFTSFSGLPGIKLNKSSSEIDTSNLDELFSYASSIGFDQPVLTYGGDFIFDILNMDISPERKKLFFDKTLVQKKWPSIIHSFSDEAGGYSNKIEADREKAISYKQSFPSLKTALFGHTSKDLEPFNKLFSVGLYSSVRKAEIKRLEKFGQSWGLYNAASGSIQDPRFAFGEGLFIARKAGASFYYDWHLSAFQNYPYFDLDGREGDIAMLYPRRNGDIYPALKFEMATQGLSLFRKLTLIENSINNGIGTKSGLKKAKIWLKQFNSQRTFYSHKSFQSQKSFEFEKVNSKVNQILLKLFP